MTVPTINQLVEMGAKPWFAALYRKSLIWMAQGMDEIEFFRRWRALLDNYRAKHASNMRTRRRSDPESSRAALRRHYHKDAPKSRRLARESRQRRKSNPERLSKYRAYCRRKMAKRLKEDINFRIRHRARNRIWMSLNRGVAKAGRTVDLIGCTIPEYRAHIESLWQPGMTWDNYGKHGWHIDHIKPLADFDLSSPEEQKKAFHFSNTRPLWEFENLSKGRK